MSDQATPKTSKPRKPKTSLDHIADIDAALDNITSVNELTFVWNRVKERIDKAMVTPLSAGPQQTEQQ